MTTNLAKKRTLITRAVRYQVQVECVVKLFGSKEEVLFDSIDISETGLSMFACKDIIPYNLSSILEISISEWNLTLVSKFVKKENTNNGIFMAVKILYTSDDEILARRLHEIKKHDTGEYYDED